MGYLPSAIGSGLGYGFGILIVLLVSIFIANHNKKLTKLQKKKSDRNSWIFLGVILLIIVLGYLIGPYFF